MRDNYYGDCKKFLSKSMMNSFNGLQEVEALQKEKGNFSGKADQWRSIEYYFGKEK